MFDTIREALAELVAVRTLEKSRARAANHAEAYPSDENYATSDALNTEIARRKAAAWEAAERALAHQLCTDAIPGELVEQRLRTWRERQMNRSGDQLALDDYMSTDAMEDLIDFVCDPPVRQQEPVMLNGLTEADTAATASAASPQPASPLTDAQIREVFVANGFSIKEGQTDLKPYVYQAARALLAIAQRPAPAVEQVQHPSGWTSVMQGDDVHLPPVGTTCLVYSRQAWEKEPSIKIDRWDEQSEAWSSQTIPIGPGWDDHDDFYSVIAWMALPTAPEATHESTR